MACAFFLFILLVTEGCSITPKPVFDESMVDPIQEADYLFQSTKQKLAINSWLDPRYPLRIFINQDYLVIFDYDSHRIFDATWVAAAMTNHLSSQELFNRFSKICSNQGGKIVKLNGDWCVDKKTGKTPLFWYEGAFTTVTEYANDRFYHPPGYKLRVIAPAKGMAPTNKAWLEYAKSQGFASSKSR